MLRRSAISVAIGMCFMGAAWAAESGGLRISITGNNGQPLAGATVKISSPSSLVTKTAVTEADGSVRVAGLDPATDYKVEVVAPGYQTFSATDVVVVSGANLALNYPLGTTAGGDNVQKVVVTSSRLAQVDSTSATVGTILNLGVVESLPTSRSYQGYLQLVPGVKPAAGGNPSSKSGVNYSDIGGATGTSTDNVYILDGVDVTDSNTGTFGSNINSEIIQEQQILTGGIPAEYAGGSGLVSKVITKSGGDEFHGSINYYFQNDNLVADNKHIPGSGFSAYDAAVTLGGPIIKEKLWFFSSYQKKARETDVSDTDGNPMRTVNRDEKLGFIKLTWQATENDRLVASFFNDPTTISGSTASTTLNNRDRRQDQGGDNFKIDYTKDIGNLRVNVYAFRHESEVSSYSADQTTLNNVAFRNASPTPTIAQRSLGGAGSDVITERNRDEVGISGEYFLETAMGSHTFKAGFLKSENEFFEDSLVSGPEKARYTSIAAQNAGVSFSEYLGTGWTGTRSLVAADIPRFITAINASPDKAYFVGLLDTNASGTVTEDEVRAYRFASTAGNPGGQVNNYRIREVQAAPYTVTATGKAFYLQDAWTLDKLTINAGMRAEEWTHYDSTDNQSAKFEWKIAPRLSAVYDLKGDGRSKVWGFLGRYYDPIRTNMSDFAGNLTGPILDEQVHLGDRWLTFRTRGGPKTPDALFAPSTKTPYTDELMLGWATSIGRDYTLSMAYTKRQTRDILEDYDLALYSDPTLTIPADEGYAAPGSKYYLPYSYFGYAAAPNSNYVIGTLAGGKRDYQGLEVSLNKQKRDQWQGNVSWTYNHAKGNTNSDSNADFQGDWLALDPRAPNAYGDQPGNIKHIVKAWGTYFFKNGLELSGVFNWNSGVLYSRTQLISGRNLPMMGDAYVDGGVLDTWILPGSIGAETAPAYYELDVRLKYVLKFANSQKVELFLDVFNILDKQSATSEMGIVAGSGAYKFGEANAWVQPRRFYVGARYSF